MGPGLCTMSARTQPPLGAVGAVELHVGRGGVLLRLPAEELAVEGRRAREVGARELDVDDRCGHACARP